jgi:hypothetical protein
MVGQLEQIMLEMRPAFKRETTFEWFVLLLWGALLTTQLPALNGLPPIWSIVPADYSRHRVLLPSGSPQRVPRSHPYGAERSP